MKKAISVLLVVLFLLCLGGCGGGKAPQKPDNTVYRSDIQDYIKEVLDDTATISVFEVAGSTAEDGILTVSCVAMYSGNTGENKGTFTLTYSNDGKVWTLEKCRVDLDQNNTDYPTNDSTQNNATEEPLIVADLRFAFISKAAGTPDGEKIASGFKKACEDIGVTHTIEIPQKDYSVEEQIEIINDLIEQEVDGIAVDANDVFALEATLNDAIKRGISVVTVGTDAKGSQMFINPMGVTEVAQAMLDAVYDITGGAGNFAVLSGAPTAVMQNAWVEEMKKLINANQKYSDLTWIDTVYGDDVPTQAQTEAELLLQKSRDLDCICCPSTVGTLACATVVSRNNVDIKVTGIGMPSEMKGFLGEGNVCPYVYLLNPEKLGETAANVLLTLADGSMTCTVGESVTVNNGSTYIVFEEDHSANIWSPQIAVPLLKITEENIEEWAKIY